MDFPPIFYQNFLFNPLRNSISNLIRFHCPFHVAEGVSLRWLPTENGGCFGLVAQVWNLIFRILFWAQRILCNFCLFSDFLGFIWYSLAFFNILCYYWLIKNWMPRKSENFGWYYVTFGLCDMNFFYYESYYDKFLMDLETNFLNFLVIFGVSRLRTLKILFKLPTFRIAYLSLFRPISKKVNKFEQKS